MFNNYPVYLINLDYRQDRLEKATQRLMAAGFNNIHRISAVNGSEIDYQQLQVLVDKEALRKLGKIRATHEELGSTGAIGCYLSHYKVWAQILKSGTPSLVVEDDAVFKHTNYFLGLNQNVALQNYDFTLLGCVLRDVSRNGLKKGQIYPLKGKFFCTDFYFLTPAGARKLLETALPIKWQVDSYMSMLILNGKINAGYHHPALSKQDRSLGTDIQTPMHAESARFKNFSTSSTTVCCICICFILLFALLIGGYWWWQSSYPTNGSSIVIIAPPPTQTSMLNQSMSNPPSESLTLSLPKEMQNIPQAPSVKSSSSQGSSFKEIVKPEVTKQLEKAQASASFPKNLLKRHVSQKKK